MRINEDRDKSKSSKATLSIYKWISKGLGHIFKNFREIRLNPTEDQGIKKNMYLQRFLQPYQQIFSVAKRFYPYLQPYQKIFFVEIAI